MSISKCQYRYLFVALKYCVTCLLLFVSFIVAQVPQRLVRGDRLHFTCDFLTELHHPRRPPRLQVVHVAAWSHYPYCNR